MNEYETEQNKNFLFNASLNMVKDKINKNFDNYEDLKNVLDNEIKLIKNKNYKYNCIELNRLTLYNVKKYYENKQNTELLDNNIISEKLKDLEKERLNGLKSTGNVDINIINSLNRNLKNDKQRNNITLFIKNKKLKINKLFLPQQIKNITPFIYVSIEDSDKIYNFLFIYSNTAGVWDIWENKEEIKEIYLNSNKFILSIKDFNNTLINMGNDNYNIKKIIKEENFLFLETNNNLNIEIGDFIVIDNKTIKILDIFINKGIKNYVIDEIEKIKDNQIIVLKYQYFIL